MVIRIAEDNEKISGVLVRRQFYLRQSTRGSEKKCNIFTQGYTCWGFQYEICHCVYSVVQAKNLNKVSLNRENTKEFSGNALKLSVNLSRHNTYASNDRNRNTKKQQWVKTVVIMQRWFHVHTEQTSTLQTTND